MIKSDVTQINLLHGQYPLIAITFDIMKLREQADAVT